MPIILNSPKRRPAAICAALWISTVLSVCSYGQDEPLPVSLLTTPERTSYQQTSTHAEVLALIDALMQRSNLIHRETLLTTPQGRDIPLLIVADPPVRSPAEAVASGKPVIAIQGNIHGGEVEGKEAIQILLRDIVIGHKAHLLENQILALVPIYNADGNDDMSADSRPSQEMSPPLAGQRTSRGLDLNRDGIAVEAVETAGLYRNLLQRWDPQLFVDMHTTNGTWHGYALTYAPSYHTAGDPQPSAYTMDRMLPAINAAVKEKFNLDLFLFGDFSLDRWPPTEFRTFHHAPRYLTNYLGLRNRMAILSETFAHDRFYLRIYAANVFIEEILEYTRLHGAEIMRINREADERTVALATAAGLTTRGVRYEMAPLAQPVTLRSYNHIPYLDETGAVRYVRSAEIIDIPNVSNFNRFVPVESATVPRAYLIPAALEQVVAKLQQHGITVERLQSPAQVTGEEFVISSRVSQTAVLNGHRNTVIEGSYRKAERVAEAGDYLVSMAQPLANLVFYLLEPRSDDGLVFWNFFDAWFDRAGLGAGETSGTGEVLYPVFKVFADGN